jgi:hypothetical protein
MPVAATLVGGAFTYDGVGAVTSAG